MRISGPKPGAQGGKMRVFCFIVGTLMVGTSLLVLKVPHIAGWMPGTTLATGVLIAAASFVAEIWER
jgi:hypothetical protein